MGRHFLMTTARLRTILCIVASMTAVLLGDAQYIASHTFSINDVIGTFDGATYSDDDTILCDVPGSTVTCPAGVMPMVEDGNTLYPINSEFGFKVVDFLGAVRKSHDSENPSNNDYMEGFAGNIEDGPEVVGLMVSNTATESYKAPARFGTWCSGMGGTSVKCSTEHYTVMEHILSCHETVPYFYADPLSGKQSVLALPDGEETDCASENLDLNAFLVENGTISDKELNYTNPFSSMSANDNDNVLNDVAVTEDFSVTLKEDGKLLYRWGNKIKRANDIRLRAKIALPDEWKVPSADIEVYSAYLVVDHLITNNPNDQLRAEDLENEAATGRKPSYKVTEDERWETIKDCYEGDGDSLDNAIEATPIGMGAVLRNPSFSHMLPYNSEDIEEGFTNAWYTTLDRDPFEWSYMVNNDDPNQYEFIGSLIPLHEEELAIRNLTLVSGPRWRLRANKFGQDIPGLKIPKQECSKPPFKHDNIKYEVGERVETWINLLDSDGDSPLSHSSAWVDHEANFGIDAGTVKEVDGKFVSQNGLVMTDDFDLAVYIKGDKKPTAIYSATLLIDYEGGPPAGLYNLRMVIHGMSEERVIFGEIITVTFEIFNDGPARSPGSGIYYTVRYSDNETSDEDLPPPLDVDPLPPIPSGESTGELPFIFVSPTSRTGTSAKKTKKSKNQKKPKKRTKN